MDAVSSGTTSKFLSAINKYAEEQRNKLSQEAERLKQAEKIRIEDEILQDAYNLIKKEMSEMITKISSERSKKEFESRNRLFKKREEITQKVFDAAKQELKKFTDTEQYPQYLKNSAKKISLKLKQKGTIIFISDKDEKFISLISESFAQECQIKISSEINIGGMKAFNDKLGVIIDETLDSKLLCQYDWFIENSGLSVC